MAFNWNFRPKTINGFNSQPVDTLTPQAQQPIQMSPVGLRGNETWRNKYDMPQTQRAVYMDEYEADEARKAMEPVLAQQASQGRIESIQNEIAELEKRIAENTARLQNFEGSADQIAALEARKINSSDPTTIWRWKQQVDELKKQRAADLARIQAEKENAGQRSLQNLKYKIDAQLKPMNIGMNTTDADIKMWNNTLADLEEQGLAGDVGEDYMNKIWDMQRSLNNPILPASTAVQLANDMDTIASQYDVVKEQGGYGKDRNAYLSDLDAKWEEIKALYESNGMDVPTETRKQYIALRNKYNKKKTSPRPGAPKNPGRK